MVARLHNTANDNGHPYSGSGVCLHSGPVMYEPCVIFAIDAASNGRDERQCLLGVAQFKLWCFDHDVGVKELAGVYNGTREAAFLMLASDFKALDVKAIWCSGQESILHLSGTRGPLDPNAGFRIASLEFANGGIRRLGRFRRVNASEAASYACSTYEPENGWGDGGYWVAGEPMKDVTPA